MEQNANADLEQKLASNVELRTFQDTESQALEALNTATSNEAEKKSAYTSYLARFTGGSSYYAGTEATASTAYTSYLDAQAERRTAQELYDAAQINVENKRAQIRADYDSLFNDIQTRRDELPALEEQLRGTRAYSMKLQECLNKMRDIKTQLASGVAFTQMDVESLYNSVKDLKDMERRGQWYIPGVVFVVGQAFLSLYNYLESLISRKSPETKTRTQSDSRTTRDIVQQTEHVLTPSKETYQPSANRVEQDVKESTPPAPTLKVAQITSPDEPPIEDVQKLVEQLGERLNDMKMLRTEQTTSFTDLGNLRAELASVRRRTKRLRAKKRLERELEKATAEMEEAEY